LAPCSPPSRTLRAAQARWPSAILDRGCARRLGVVRPGRGNGPFQPNQETRQVGRAAPSSKGSPPSTHAKRRGGTDFHHVPLSTLPQPSSLILIASRTTAFSTSSGYSS